MNPREMLTRLQGVKLQLEQRQETLKKGLETAKEGLCDTVEAQALIQKAALLTQEELKFQISELVSLALSAVFEDPYEFEVVFEQRRNQLECDLMFKRDGALIDPLFASGGGAVDVAAFALRVALWSMKANKTRPLLILDEPLKFLKGGDLPERGAKMMKEISEKLGIQIIYVSHIPEQVESADRVHTVKMRKGISKIE